MSSLWRFGSSRLIKICMTELPIARDILCEHVFCRMYKPD
jgi:hypothetical protein